MKPITLDFHYRSTNRFDPFAEHFIERGRPIPAIFYVVMVSVDLDAQGGILRTDVLPTIYATESEARAAADALPSATGVLAIQGQVHSAKALIKDPQIL